MKPLSNLARAFVLPASAALVAAAAAFFGLGIGHEPRHAAAAVGVAPGASETRPLVEIFSWWTAPGEAEALEALVRTHDAAHPKARLFNAAAASGQDAKSLLHRRLDRGDPPDLFQENIHDLRASVQAGTVHLEPLDDLFDRLGLGSAVFPEVLKDVTMDGHVVAMPVNLHRENSLFYNVHVFERLHLAPPSTYEEFVAACQTLKAAGITPLATSHQGWILRIMFNAVALGTMGGPAYSEYFTGKSQPPTPPLRKAAEAFRDLLVNYTNDDAAEPGFGWTNAASAVKDGDAAMFLHGDWAKGYLEQLGAKPGADFGARASPGADDVFLYGVDVFAIPQGAKNEAGAREFLSTIASADGQVAFNRLKGSSPMRSLSDLGALDPLGQATVRDLSRATIRLRVRSRSVWDDAFAAFAKSRDVDALLKAFADNPPTE